ncbi:hypothetical protein JTE90_004448 [Oedothorax gibbosus]|uniref:Uncharacterized protein n=1 Tax=Oedothorax gibbosus TaxID=931172 RepID=A0AAV6UQM5_9ARAC|nr:hypothetical protein JTE90_004448 [Oedothorax gibbosus]
MHVSIRMRKLPVIDDVFGNVPNPMVSFSIFEEMSFDLLCDKLQNFIHLRIVSNNLCLLLKILGCLILHQDYH